MIYKIEFEVDCTTATAKELKKELKYLTFTDVDDIISFPRKIKVTQIK